MIFGSTVLEFQLTGWFLIRGTDLCWTTGLKNKETKKQKNIHMYTPTCPTCTHLGSENCPHFKGRLKMHCGLDHEEEEEVSVMEGSTGH